MLVNGAGVNGDWIKLKPEDKDDSGCCVWRNSRFVLTLRNPRSQQGPRIPLRRGVVQLEQHAQRQYGLTLFHHARLCPSPGPQQGSLSAR